MCTKIFFMINMCNIYSLLLFGRARSAGAVGAAFAPLAENWMFKFQPRETLVVKTGNYNSGAKRLAI